MSVVIEDDEGMAEEGVVPVAASDKKAMVQHHNSLVEAAADQQARRDYLAEHSAPNLSFVAEGQPHPRLFADEAGDADQEEPAHWQLLLE